MNLPDLENGYMVMGSDSKKGNCWQTYIEACLIRNNKDYAYLASDCRAEFVARPGPLIGQKFCEASAITTWKGDFLIRAGSGIYHPFRRRISEELHYSNFAAGIKVVSNNRQVKPREVPDLVYELNEGAQSNKYYMSVKYKMGDDYEIICPCRYINFPDKRKFERIYLQPISGYILFEENDRFFIAYIVTYLTDRCVVSTEIVKRVPTFIFDTKFGIGGISVKILRDLFVPLKRWLLVDDFTSVSKIDAKVQVFSYA